MNDHLTGVRQRISIAGVSEIEALNDSEYLKLLFDRKQEIIRNMTEAKRIAVEKAIEPFQKELDEINNEYNTLLLISNI